MKTILVLTDFSISADYTAHYALELAQRIEANLLECNIYEVPAGKEITDGNSWLLRACTIRMKIWKGHCLIRTHHQEH